MRNKNRNTFLSFLISYILVTMIPLCICFGFFYSRASDDIVNHSLSKSMSDSQYAMRKVDEQLDFIYDIPYALFKDDKITNLAFDNNAVIRLKAVNAMNQLRQNYSFINEMSIYLRETQYFIFSKYNALSINNMLKYQGHYGIYYKDWAIDEMQHTLDKINGKLVRPAESVILNGITHDGIITFIETLPQNNTFAYATVMIMVSGEKIDALIPNLDENDIFMLYDNEGNLIYSIGSYANEIAPTVFKRLSSTEGAEVYNFNKSEYVMSWAKSVDHGWSCASLTLLEPILENLKSMRSTAFIIAISSALIASLLITMFMRVNYKPLENIVLAVDKIVSLRSKTSSYSHYQKIQQAIDLLDLNNFQLNKNIDEMRPMLREQVIRDLLTNQEPCDIDNLLRKAMLAGIDAQMPMYQALLISVPDKQILNSLFSLLDGHNIPGIQCVLSGTDYISVVLGGEKEALAEKCIICIDRFERDSGSNIYIGAGNVVNNIIMFKESYANAYVALDYARIHAIINSVVNYEELPESTFRSHTYSMQIIQSLSFSISQNNVSSVEMFITQITSAIRLHVASPFFIRSLYYSAASLLLNSLSSFDDEKVKSLSMRVNFSLYSADEMASILQKLFCLYKDFTLQFLKQSKNDHMSDILTFIDSRVESRKLSLSDVADEFGMSASYFSRQFKQETGRNFKGYVDALRLEHAKMLLKTTDMLISDIACKIGYDNSYSFTRLFKKNIGITPTEYRESSTKKGV